MSHMTYKSCRGKKGDEYIHGMEKESSVCIEYRAARASGITCSPEDPTALRIRDGRMGEGRGCWMELIPDGLCVGGCGSMGLLWPFI
mmetsp:Transcript_1172/g.4139  ORF Transcript_1172/g.4139 Transcript_1172/m.4139 type:complete len:87 (+) Transcript_1172:241-501(+)